MFKIVLQGLNKLFSKFFCNVQNATRKKLRALLWRAWYET